MRAAALALLLAACGAASAFTLTPAHETVLRQFKSPAEKTAKDAAWTAPEIFKVGVLDNGTPRDGYAQYVCAAIEDTALRGRGVWVQVIDVAKLKRTGEWKRLGESRCR